jgi:hypothetical protein
MHASMSTDRELESVWSLHETPRSSILIENPEFRRSHWRWRMTKTVVDENTESLEMGQMVLLTEQLTLWHLRAQIWSKRMDEKSPEDMQQVDLLSSSKFPQR